MSTSTPDAFFSLGKQVKDEYGRIVGKVASFTVNPNGEVENIILRRGDGEFSRYPVSYLKIDGDSVTLISTIKLKCNKLCNDIPLIWRKDQALRELLKKNKVPGEMYEDIHKNFEGALKQLKAEAQGVLEDIDKQIAKCEKEIQELNSALINLEIEHEIGKIGDEAYQTAMEIVQEGLKWAKAEKDDLESSKKRLSNILLGEETKAPAQKEEEEKKEEETPEEKPTAKSQRTPATPPASSPVLPEPPVVVYVKDREKSSL